MTEDERDDRVMGAYRALGDASPPPAVDAAILAAARRRAPRWRAPLAAAAALVLAVGLAVVVDREAPLAPEPVALAPQVIPAPAPSRESSVRRQEPAQLVERRALAPAAAPHVGVRGAGIAEDQTAMGASRPSESQKASREAPASAAADSIAIQAPPSAVGALRSNVAGRDESAEQWLERIARLRDAGKRQEADDALAAFRRRYPGYEIPEKMRARVLPR